MDERDMVLKNRILEIKTGSTLFGLLTPTSDTDYSGIFLPNKEYVFGFRKCENVSLSIKNKLENNKNSQFAIDRDFFEFRKFIKLALDNNPSILELLFVNEENIEFINEFGRELLNKAVLFPHKGLKERFIGYSSSQKKKMIIKKDHYLDLEKAELILNKIINEGDDKLLLPQCTHYDNFERIFKIKKQTDNHYRIGERSLIKNQTVKRALSEIQKIIGEATNRKEFIKKNGYCTKFASHMIRLLLEGIELLETGKLVFPLQNKKELMEIKTGKWNLQDVLDYSKELEDKVNQMKKTSDLPFKPRMAEIEKYMIEVLEKWIYTK